MRLSSRVPRLRSSPISLSLDGRPLGLNPPVEPSSYFLGRHLEQQLDARLRQRHIAQLIDDQKLTGEELRPLRLALHSATMQSVRSVKPPSRLSYGVLRWSASPLSHCLSRSKAACSLAPVSIVTSLSVQRHYGEMGRSAERKEKPLDGWTESAIRQSDCHKHRQGAENRHCGRPHCRMIMIALG